MATATFNKFEAFVGDLADGVHDILGSTVDVDIDDIKIYLSNAAPNAATHAVKADIAEITAENGYTAGGDSVTPVGARSGGTVTLSGDEVVIAASGGTIGPFQYVVLYNDTSPDDSLIGWWARAEPLTLNDGESFTWKPDNQAAGGTILTLT